MPLLDGRSRRLSLWSVLLATLVLCAGCQTSVQSLFTASGLGWRVQEGQALWRPRKGLPEIAGDLVVVRDENQRCLLQFSKTPITLVTAQTTSNRWLIQFPPRQWSFSGHHRPPARFAWLYLPMGLSGQPLPPPFRFEPKPDGGWRLENTSTGESMEGFLAP